MSYQVAQQKLIYVFEIPGSDTHRDLLKIGETTFDGKDLKAAAKKRIDAYTRTAGIKYNLLHTELALTDSGETFSDRDVHHVLNRSGIKKETIKGTAAREWFKVSLPDAIAAIKAVKRGEKFIRLKKIYPKTEQRPKINFRDEQLDAINRTVEYFKQKGNNKFLWNAKMRFGKTLCALEVVRRKNFAKTIIITHRPVVNAGWFEDYQKIFGGNEKFLFGSKDRGASLENLLGGKKNFVYFASIQDLRGSDTVGGKHDKNSEAFEADWDCVIVDEAHEGTQTPLGDAVIKELVKEKTKFLALSGTPFNLLDDFDEESVYTWDYIMEQRAKADFEKNFPLEHNPYAELPKMNIYAYDLGKLLNKPDYVENKTFNFREFFRTDEDKFVHAADVKNFLDLLVKRDDNNYPFSREEWRDMFRHTFWIVPGVEAGRALSIMLKRHKVFGQFEIVNVAGDGDPEDKNGDALKAVQDAIAENDYTITISCGKLTAGVTVPEWSAVFMLAGSYSTSAMNYLQTIFRVQSPCRKGGFIKKNCYVFDFAPDRTLKMVAESVAVSVRAGKSSRDDSQALKDFLQFCPVISLRGSEMKELKSDDLFRQLKRAYAERVVRNGFEDRYLYDNDKLSRLTNFDLFDKLRGIIGKSKAQDKTSDITINKNGLTASEKKKLSKELNREPTPEEIEARRQRLIRRNAISNLRVISIRMPLLIYGADVPFDDNITIEKFADLIDDESWEEFMPKGVTKEFFANFIQYYDRDVFIEAGNTIRERTKAADKLKPTDRVEKIAKLFATFKNPDKETVLTPWRVVNLHIDSAFDEKFFMPDKKILEINSKTGLYPLYVALKIYRARLGEFEEDDFNLDALQRTWDKTVAEDVFVICKTPMAEAITKRTLVGYRQSSVNAKFYSELLVELKNLPSRFIKRITEKNFWNKGGGKMFFDGVVGNPPYQIVGSGDNQNFAAPVYHEFIKISYNRNLTKHASLIHPARFLFNAGATPGDFAENFLKDKHVRIVKYFPKSQELFPSSFIEGGIAITEFDATKIFEPIEIFIPFDELRSACEKITARPDFVEFGKIISGRTPYLFTDKLHEENPDVKNKLSKGHSYDISSNAFAALPEIFSTEEPSSDCLRVLGRLNNDRAYCWIKREYVRGRVDEYIGKWKIFLPQANGASGKLGEEAARIISKPVIGKPFEICTDTFLVVGAFDSEAEAQACLKYVKSKFARCLLGILKATQVNTRSTWSKVPLQDFTSAGEIDWSLPIKEIDARLYSKYNLSEAEIKFIEEKVRAME